MLANGLVLEDRGKGKSKVTETETPQCVTPEVTWGKCKSSSIKKKAQSLGFLLEMKMEG